MDMERLRSELERLFELDELLTLSSELLGFNPKEIGGTAGKAAFVRALTDYCETRGALEALCDAVVATRPDADARLMSYRNVGLWQRRELGPGEAIDGFVIERWVGDGPQGSCYLATRNGVRHRVKVLHPECTRDARSTQRFLTYNRLLAVEAPPGFPRGVEVVSNEARTFVAQHWFEGESLAARFAQGGPIPQSELFSILLEVAEALAALHERRLVHGNLKAENIIVAPSEDGRREVQLQDAGADLLGARRAPNGLIQVLSLSAPKTVAPERLRGKERSAAGDVYALGAICHELVSGQSPFAGDTALDAAVLHLTTTPPPPSTSAPAGWVTPDFEAFILRLLDKDPARRPADGRALLDELRKMSEAELPARATEGDVDDKIAALMLDPENEQRAHELDAVATGGFRERAYEAFARAAAQLRGDVEGQRASKAALLMRAARGFASIRKFDAAEAAYVALVGLGRTEPQLLTALDDVRHELGKHEEVIEALLGRLDALTKGEERAAVLARIGEIYARHLHDDSQAVVALSQALSEDPTNKAYVRRIEAIAGADAALWSEVLGTCSEAASDEDRDTRDRAPLLEQMGLWYIEKQGRAELALPCFQTALKLDPKRGRALDGVASVYRSNKMWSELSDLLVHRADSTASPSDARELRLQAAQVLEKHLDDPDAAREIYERIIREDPGDLVVSQALTRIYEKNQEIERLVPLLQRQAEEERGARRHTALCRLGELYRSHLGDPEEARRCYEAVLREAPAHAQAIAGLDQVLAQTGQYKDLLNSLHRQLASSPTPRQQVELWERIAQLYEQEFLLHADAAVALESVLKLDPTRTSAMVSLARLYRVLEQWYELSELFRRHSESVTEVSEKLPLLMQRARVLAEHVGDLPGAIKVYEQVAQLAPERIDALEAIADLREALGNTAEAIQAVQEIAERATEKDAKVRYAMRAARLLESRGATDESIDWYARVVALEPGHPRATQALRHAYAERGNIGGLIDLLRRDMQLADSERTKARLSAEIAALELTRNKNPAAAEQAARQALEWDSSNLRATVLLGDIAFAARRYAEAMEYYEAALPRADTLPVNEAARVIARYLDAADQSPSRNPGEMLRQSEILVQLTPDDPEALARAADLAFHHGPAEQTARLYGTLLERFRDDLTEDQQALATYRLGEARRLTGDADAALASLEEASLLAPDSPHPLVAQIQIHEARGDWARAGKIKRRLLALLEPEQRADLLTELGEMAIDRQGDVAQARADFNAALALRPDDRRVLTRLMQIHSESKSWAELVEVVSKLASFVDDPAQKAKYLMTAAMVSARQLGRREQASAFYRQVLALDPTHSKALGEYVVLQIEQGDSASAEQALQKRLQMARDSGDKATQIDMLDALFTLYNGVPGRLDSAVEVAEQAAALEPQSAAHSGRLKELYEKDTAKYLERAVALHMRTLRVRPDDEDAYRRLRRLYTDARRADAAWCLCQVLHLLKLAEPEESRFFERSRSEEPAPAQNPLTEPDWAELITHPSVDQRLTHIFTILEPVVIASRGQPLPNLGYDPRLAVDLSQHPYPLGNMLFYSAGVLGMPLPPTFENHHEPGGLLYLNSNPPSIVMGLSAMQQLPLQTAAFIAARQLANYRPGFLLRHLLPSLPMLKAWLFAAFKVCSPHFPVVPELEGPVLEARAAIERFLPPAGRDRLVELVSRLIQASGAIDLKEWVTGVDLTADRAGLVVANDLKSVTDIIKTVEDPSAPPRERRLQEVILFAIDEPYFKVRQRLGIALEST